MTGAALRPLLDRAAGPVRRMARKALLWAVPDLSFIDLPDLAWNHVAGNLMSCEIDPDALLYPPYALIDCKVGGYTYIAENASMGGTTVGRFCSLGPNLVCGRPSTPS